MLYSELLNLTDDKATYEQFLDIEVEYMKKDSMTKEQAAKLWKRRYGEKVYKPRPEEMRRIKEAIRIFKGERQWAKIMEQRINKEYDNLIQERLHDFYGKTLKEINSEQDSTTAWSARRIIDEIEKQRNRTLNQWYDEAGNDTTIYIIYKDGSTQYVTGTEIVGGKITPKMQAIAYAYYFDGWDEFDTEIGDWDLGLYGKTADEYNYDIIDEMLLIKDKYESDIEIKYKTEWGLKYIVASDIL